MEPMSETMIKRLAERASNHPVHGDLMLAAARTIRSLEEQVREKDRQIDDWERAAQRWVTQIRVAGPVAMSRENTPTNRLKRWMRRIYKARGGPTRGGGIPQTAGL
jgi:hypothetical protein